MKSSEGRDPQTALIAAQRVREANGRITVAIPGHSACEEPTVELVREGNIVRAIDITCPCGRRLRILCDYEGSGET